MDGFILYLGTATALIFVIEGLLYALFPDGIQRLMVMAVSLPPARLRLFGLAMAAMGFCTIGLLYAAPF